MSKMLLARIKSAPKNLLTPYSSNVIPMGRIFFENLKSLSWSRISLAYYGTRRFIATKSHDCIPHVYTLFKIHCLSNYLLVGFLSCPLHLSFSTKIYAFVIFPCVLHIPSIIPSANGYLMNTTNYYVPRYTIFCTFLWTFFLLGTNLS
jgi:hypothetical protein